MFRPYEPHQVLEYNRTGQTLEFYPPFGVLLLEGAPSTGATVTVWEGTESNDSASEFTGTATLDSVSTTLSAAAGVSQTVRNQVTLAAVTGIAIGRMYLLEGDSRREIVVPSAINTSTKVVTLLGDLAFDYASGSGSTFKGIRHSYIVPDAFITTSGNINVYGGYTPPFIGASGDDLGISAGTWRWARWGQSLISDTMSPPYRAQWVWTVGSTVRADWTSFDLARQVIRGNITIEDLVPDFPDLRDTEWRRQKGQDFQPQMDAALRDLRFRLRMRGVALEQVNDPLVLKQLLITFTLAKIGEAGLVPRGRDRETWIRERRERYVTAEADAFGPGLKAWVSTGSTGNSDARPAKRLALRK